MVEPRLDYRQHSPEAARRLARQVLDDDLATRQRRLARLFAVARCTVLWGVFLTLLALILVLLYSAKQAGERFSESRDRMLRQVLDLE